MEKENLDSFYFKEKIDGIEHDYRITKNDIQYDIEQNGEVIGAIIHNTVWQSVGESHLSPACVEKIGEAIENHYE